MEKIRTFIAIRLNSDVKAKLSSIQDEMRKCEGDVKWVKPDNIHITLKFLGYALQSQLKDIFKATDESIKEIKPFTLSFCGLGAFPNPKNPRVIWVRVEEGGGERKEKGQEILSRISRNLEEILSKYGFKREERPFHPHLTLGRVKSPWNMDSLVKAVQSQKDCSAGSMEVNEVVVMQSLLKPEGPEYSALHMSRLRET